MKFSFAFFIFCYGGVCYNKNPSMILSSRIMRSPVVEGVKIRAFNNT